MSRVPSPLGYRTTYPGLWREHRHDLMGIYAELPSNDTYKSPAEITPCEIALPPERPIRIDRLYFEPGWAENKLIDLVVGERKLEGVPASYFSGSMGRRIYWVGHQASQVRLLVRNLNFSSDRIIGVLRYTWVRDRRPPALMPDPLDMEDLMAELEESDVMGGDIKHGRRPRKPR